MDVTQEESNEVSDNNDVMEICSSPSIESAKEDSTASKEDCTLIKEDSTPCKLDSTTCKIDSSACKEDCHWDDALTRELIECYKKLRHKVGTDNIKTLKKMWMMISEELTSEHENMNITAGNCENRWRVLERNYRKYIDSKNIGRKRKFCEFADEMERLLGNKNYNPEILNLNSSEAAFIPLDHDYHQTSISDTSEILIIQPSMESFLPVESAKEDCRWNENLSKRLIYFYEKLNGKVGTSKIKTLKKMWAVISEALSSEYHMNISAGHCENRWRVLERNYRKCIQGRGRKNFEFVDDFDRILGYKNEMLTETVISSEAAHIPQVQLKDISHSGNLSTAHIPRDQLREIIYSVESPSMDGNDMVTHDPKVLKHIASTIEKIRQDKVEYQKKQLKILENRNDLIKQRNYVLRQDKLAYQNKKIKILESKNDILEKILLKLK